MPSSAAPHFLMVPDQEGEVQRAAAMLAAASAPGTTPLLAAAQGLHAWLQVGEARAPMRAALVRHWTRHGLLHAPVPLTGPAALRAEVAWDPERWTPAFLTALADEAEEALLVLGALERAWFAARGAVAGRRRHSRAPAAIDLLAATPLLSASTLAQGLGMAVKNAAALLDEFRAAGLVVEVTHRCKRRLFGLAGLAPLREGVGAAAAARAGAGQGTAGAPAGDAGGAAAHRAVGPARATGVRLRRAGGGDGAGRGEHPAGTAEPRGAARARSATWTRSR